MRELELKFSLPLSLQDSLARDDTGDRIERVWSCYYDTPDGALARARMAVRVRRKGDAWLQTVKADDGDRFDRFEWERPISGNVPEREALPPEDTPQGALAHRTFAQWRPLFETDFERRARVVEPAPGLSIELAQDVGEVHCAEHRESIREVEFFEHGHRDRPLGHRDDPDFAVGARHDAILEERSRAVAQPVDAPVGRVRGPGTGEESFDVEAGLPDHLGRGALAVQAIGPAGRAHARDRSEGQPVAGHHRPAETIIPVDTGGRPSVGGKGRGLEVG